MEKSPETDRNDGELAERGLRELTEGETALGGGWRYRPAGGPTTITRSGPSFNKTMKQMPKLGMVSMAAVISAWVGVLGPPALAAPAAVPVTGQTECFDLPGKVIDCVGTGEDGDIQAGVPFPTPRFVDKKNGTVKDRLTGLIWLKDANCFGAVTFNQALIDTSTLATGRCGLSDGSRAGDWRMPNVKEFQSLIDFGFVPTISNAAGTGPWTPGDPFVNLIGGYYWSSTSVPSGPNDAWVMIPIQGNIYGFHRTNRVPVWPVRGGEVREGE